MEVTLVGVGLGNPSTLTAGAAAALKQADGLIGSRRLLEECPLPQSVPRKFSTKSAEIVEILKKQSWQNPCVLYSGDTGFYSGARTLVPLLEAEHIPFQVLPGISSLQYFAARLGRSWQEWSVVSAHGLNCDPVGEILAAHGKPVFFLTSGAEGAGSLCERLTQAGLGHLTATLGQSLSYPQEQILSDSVSRLAGHVFAPLTVLLVEGYTSCRPARLPGLTRRGFPAGRRPHDQAGDPGRRHRKAGGAGRRDLLGCGAGTGSVSVELALLAPHSTVCAVECGGEACSLIRANREKFGVYNLELTQGRAPEVLAQLPAPDAVFIGGSGGELPAILEAALRKNPAARFCITAIAVETLGTAVAAMTQLGMEPQISQVTVARSRAAGELHLMMGQNPVWIITGRKEALV